MRLRDVFDAVRANGKRVHAAFAGPEQKLIHPTAEKVLLLGGSVSQPDGLSGEVSPFGYVSEMVQASLALPQLADNTVACTR